MKVVKLNETFSDPWFSAIEPGKRKEYIKLKHIISPRFVKIVELRLAVFHIKNGIRNRQWRNR